MAAAARDQPGLLAPARLRTLYGEVKRDFSENIPTLWHARWSQVRSAIGAPGRWGGDGTGPDTLKRLLGERSLADEVAVHRAAPQAIQDHADMAEQLKLLERREATFHRLGGYSLVDLAGVQVAWSKVLKDEVPPPPESVLHLPDEPAPLPPLPPAPAGPTR